MISLERGDFMKNLKKAMLVVAMSVLVFGANNFAMADTQKIAVVNVPAVVEASSQVQALRKEQQVKMKELQKWLEVVKSDVDKQKTKEGKETLIKKYDTEFAKKQEAIRADYTKKLQAIDKNISTVIAAEAKAQGFDIVLAKGVVLYGCVDITSAVSKKVK